MRSPPRPPDLTPLSNAQVELGRHSMELAREQLGMSREQFDFFRRQSLDELSFAREQAGMMLGLQNRALDAGDAMNAISGRVADAQIGLMEQARDFAGRDRARWERTFVPLQDRFIEDAEGFNTEARREAEAGRALVDVQRAAEAQRANADARLSSMGLDPSQFRSTSIANMLGAQTAAAGAMQANAARRNVENTGRAMRADAINLGMGLPAQATQAIGVASGAGSGAVNAAGAAAQQQLAGFGTAANIGMGAANLRGGALGRMGELTGSPMQWAQLGTGAMGAAGNQFNNAGVMLSQNFSNRMVRHNARGQQFRDIAGLAGAAFGIPGFAEGGEARSVPTLDTMGLGLRRERLDPQVFTPEPIHAGPRPTFDAPRKTFGGHVMAAADRLMTRAQERAHERRMYGEPEDAGTHVPMLLRPIQMAEGGRAIGALPVRQARDTIPAVLAEGEYVVPADVVRAVGLEKLDKMVAKYHRPGA